MQLRTTAIGAYPKPDGSPVPMWTEIGGGRRSAPTKAYDKLLCSQTDSDRDMLDRMTIEAVREQVGCGIDIPTDGEIRREHYVYYHLRHVTGIDFENLTEAIMRDGSWVARVPSVRSALKAGAPFLPTDFRAAQSASERPVKITVPGPLTISDSIANMFYADQASLVRALADTLNVEIRRLAEAGCCWIQVDEPVFARQLDNALNFGVECLERCFAGVPDHVNRVVHICCGYPARLDEPEPAKASAHSYIALADALDGAKIDAISIEDAHRHNDLALLEKYDHSTVILGMINIASSRVETVDELQERMIAALGHIEARRLMVAPDCGLALLPRDLAVAKLTNLSKAAHNLPDSL